MNNTFMNIALVEDEQQSIPPRHQNEDYGSYFRRLLEGSYRAKEAVKTHETWVRRHLNGLREEDCYQRILMVLKELMLSGFLRNDYIDTGVPKNDCICARKELEELHFEDLLLIDGADWKYALLTRQFRKPEEKRVMIDEQNAGLYIDEMRDKLSVDDIESFFRFATFTSLSYKEMERMRAREKAEKENQEITPEEKAVNDFVDKVTRLVNVVYNKWNGKEVFPAVHQPAVKVVIKRDELIEQINYLKDNNIDFLISTCYPVTSKTNKKFISFAMQLYGEGYFGALPKKHFAEDLTSFVGISQSTVTSYLSQKD